MCCTWLAGNTIQDAKNRHYGTIAQLWVISSELRHVSTIAENMLNNTSSTCPDNMVNFGLLMAELRSVGEFGAPCKFQRVSRLGSITARHSSSGRQPNFAALNRGRHLYSAGRPSRWALAHISSSFCFLLLSFFLAYSQPSDIGCLPYFHTWWGLGANLECISEMCCTRPAENTECKSRQKFAILVPSHKFVGLCLHN